MNIDKSYVEGFMQKCAEHDVDAEELVKQAVGRIDQMLMGGMGNAIRHGMPGRGMGTGFKGFVNRALPKWMGGQKLTQQAQSAMGRYADQDFSKGLNGKDIKRMMEGGYLPKEMSAGAGHGILDDNTLYQLENTPDNMKAFMQARKGLTTEGRGNLKNIRGMANNSAAASGFTGYQNAPQAGKLMDVQNASAGMQPFRNALGGQGFGGGVIKPRATSQARQAFGKNVSTENQYYANKQINTATRDATGGLNMESLKGMPGMGTRPGYDPRAIGHSENQVLTPNGLQASGGYGTNRSDPWMHGDRAAYAQKQIQPAPFGEEAGGFAMPPTYNRPNMPVGAQAAAPAVGNNMQFPPPPKFMPYENQKAATAKEILELYFNK
jgi:hypothetical protein